MQAAVNVIRTAKDISLADVQAIASALFCAVKESSGSHLQPQQVVLDSLADISNWLQDELTEQEQQSALETVEWEKMKKSTLAKSWGFGESLQALQGLTIRGGV